MTAETRTIRGQTREVGSRFFGGPDFYAVLVDGDDDVVIVRDEFSGDECLFVWDATRHSYSERNEAFYGSARSPKAGAWVMEEYELGDEEPTVTARVQAGSR